MHANPAPGILAPLCMLASPSLRALIAVSVQTLSSRGVGGLRCNCDFPFPLPLADPLQQALHHIYTLTHLAAGHALKHTLLLLSGRPSLVPYTLRFKS